MADDDTMITYRLASGELIFGEYAFVCDLDYFDNADEPCEIIEETWHRAASRTLVHPAPHCTGCDNSDRLLHETSNGLLCAVCADDFYPNVVAQPLGVALEWTAEQWYGRVGDGVPTEPGAV